MTSRLAVFAAATLLVSAGAFAQDKTRSAKDESPAEAKALVQSCAAHKFETTIDITVDGQPRKSKVKLCGTEGQSDAEWVHTLQDAIAKVQANEKMPPAVKEQIVTAVNAEIAKLGGGAPGADKGSAIASLTPGGDVLSKPAPPPLAPRPLPAHSLASEYGSLPPLPAPKSEPAIAVGASSGAASLPLLSRPRLDVQCQSSTDLAGAVPCTGFDRDTLVTIQAKEDVPAGTSLRFVRGDASADVALAGLRKGRTVRFALPSDVCAGVGGGTLKVQIVRTAGASKIPQVVGSDGPYNLRC